MKTRTVRYRLHAYILPLVVGIALPFIFNAPYMRYLLTEALILATVVISLDLIIGRMGQFSFGHQAFFGVGAYTSALLSLKLGVPVWICFGAGATSAAVLGLVIGYISLRLRGLYLAIVTLGFAVIIYLVILQQYRLTGGNGGLFGIPPLVIGIPELFRIEFRSDFSYYYVALSLLILTIYCLSRLMRSRFGRAIISLRENEELAVALGVPAFKYYLVTFVIATGIAGLSGASFAHFLRVIAPDILAMYYMVMMLIVLLVGGVGTFGGPVLGAFIFIFVAEALRVTAEFRMLIFGVILLCCILFMQRGIYPTLASLWNRFTVKKPWGKTMGRAVE